MRLPAELGAVYLKNNHCTFKVWAPNARQVEVLLLTPGERLLPLQMEGDYFCGQGGDIPPGSLYFYRLNGEVDRPDPASRSQPQGVHGPSQVVTLEFPWNDQTWVGLPLQDYVIYELHVGTFTPEGSFDAVIPRLERLQELGVTAVELMPVAQFPGSRNWGYDGVFPFAVQYSYGGPEALRRLVNACHQRGLAVILDVVYNHLGPEGNYLRDFGPYFTQRYQTPWGEAINFDGPGGDEVRRYFISNALYWITDFHIDALRLDALHAVIDQSARPFLAELAEAVHLQAARLGRRVYLIAESDLNDVRHLQASEIGGYGLDSHWLDDFHHALHTLLTRETGGYYQDFGGWEHLAASYRQGFVYAGQYSTFRRRRHGSSSQVIPPYRFIAFAQNHDQIGNRLNGERLSQLVSFEALKLAAAAVILSPFTPLLFMGEEYGEKAPFLYFISHTDPDLIEAVRRGRAQEFAHFDWESPPPDPQASETFERSRLEIGLLKQPEGRYLWQYYQKLLEIRREMIATVDLGSYYPEVQMLQPAAVLSLKYSRNNHYYWVFFGFSDRPQVFDPQLPAGTWRLRLASAESRWGGPGIDLAATCNSPHRHNLVISSHACMVYSQEGTSR